MTFEEVKRELNGLRFKRQLLKKREAQMKQARDQIDCLKATDYAKIAVQGGENAAVAEVFIEYMERLQNAYDGLLEDVYRIENSVLSHMKDLTETEQGILIDRYILGKTWENIQQEYHYAQRQPFRIEKRAIQKITKKTEDDTQ